MSVNTPYVSDDVDDYKYCIGTIHLDPDDIKHYKIIDVAVEEYDKKVWPQIVVYFRHVTPTGKLLSIREENEHPIHIWDIVMYTAEYVVSIQRRFPRSLLDWSLTTS